MEAFYKALAEAIGQNRTAAVATIVKTMGSSPRGVGSKMLVYPDGRIVGSVGGGAMEARVIQASQEAMRDGRTRYLDMTLSNEERGDPLICGGEMEIFIEPLVVAPTLLIVGAGHIGSALAVLGKFLGLRVSLLDDRPELLTRENFPEADELVVGDLAAELDKLDITPQTYVVLATRAHTLDAPILRVLHDKPAAYIGMVGSRRRVLAVLDLLKEEGIPESAFERLHAPIGLPIGAETPQEIAVSIMAEIIQEKSKKA